MNRRDGRAYQAALLDWYRRMAEAVPTLTPEQRTGFDGWERRFVGGDIGTSDWPLWEDIIGPNPSPPGHG